MAETTASVDLKDLLEAGAHFGHQAKRWNPKMKRYIYTTRDGVHIFDLALTASQLTAAMDFVRDLVKEGKEVVFVGGKRQAQAIVKEEALRAGAPYVTERWLGGTLTNWEMMEGRIKRLKDQKAKRANGELNHYTKRELVLVDREISKLERFFGGLTNLTKLPEALFIVDTHREYPAVKEANKLGIPVVGLVDSNADPDLVEVVVPINDDAVRAIKLAVTKVADAYKEGKEMRSKAMPMTSAAPAMGSAKPAVAAVAAPTAAVKPEEKKPESTVETVVTKEPESAKVKTGKKPEKPAGKSVAMATGKPTKKGEKPSTANVKKSKSSAVKTTEGK